MGTELNDLRFDWLPRQKIATDTADTHMFTLYGGSRGPGKSYWLRWWLLRFILLANEAGFDHVRVGLFCENYPALKDRQLTRIEAEFPRWLGVLKESKSDGLGFHLHGRRGMIALRNLDDASKYQSAEFAAIGVDELTRNKLKVFDYLRGSLRWPGMRNVRFVAATNPGGIGHLWVKSYWVDRQYPPPLQDHANEFAFVRALPEDNIHLDASYWSMLESLPPELSRAWRYGDWDVFVGQAFAFRREVHAHKPFEIPASFPRWRCVDWGHSSPCCCLWLAQDPDTGRVYVYRELYASELTDREQARAIRQMTPASETIRATYADPSMWTKKTHEAATFSTADEYRTEGVTLVPADNNRLTGKRKVDGLLALLDDGAPGLVVFENCVNLIRTLPALPYDETVTEDVDTDAEDHAYDALRYGLSRVNPRPKPKRVSPLPSTDSLLVRTGLRLAPAVGLESRDL